MKCPKCEQEKTNINEVTGICLDCVTPLEETRSKKVLVGKLGFFEGKTITLVLCTGPYGGRISAHIKPNGPVLQYGIRAAWASVTTIIHEEDVFSVREGVFRLDAMVRELEAQGWEVKNG